MCIRDSWCDVHLDGLEDSPARPKVGFRSDVYLLGALLFEVVTSVPPHTYDGDITPYQIIRKAATNEIADHEQHVNDELMQVSLACMRLGKRKPIETIEALSTAIREYEDRLSSIELRQRAYQILSDAKDNSDYDQFQRARFGFEESLEKWEGNARAKQGLRDARISCAQLALEDQNFDLGIGMIDDPETKEEVSLKNELLSGKSKRDRRKKLVRYLALGLASSILVGLVLNGFMINENYKSWALRDQAVIEKSEAEVATKRAVEERLKIEKEVLPLRTEVQNKQIEIREIGNKLQLAKDNFEDQLESEKEVYNQKIAEEKSNFAKEKSSLTTQLEAEKESFNKQLAAEKENLDKEIQEKQVEFNQKLKAEQEQLDARLAKQQSKFENETEQLVNQKQELVQQVAELDESSKLLRYKSKVTNVRQKLQAGDYRESRQLLDTFADKSRWEVGRLNLLAHREIAAIYPNEQLIAISASANGSTFGLLFPTRIEIHRSDFFEKPLLNIPTEGVSAIAFSQDGNRLAVGKPSDSRLEPGKIWILDISNSDAAQQLRTLDAQSQTISKLEFNAATGQLLSVGVPSKLRKSSNTKPEKELMVWDRSWNPIEVKLIVAKGQLPKFSSAKFSENGRQILTTYPAGQSQEQFVHVFRKSNQGYQWRATSPMAGINTAVFENDSGTAIVGCALERQANTYSLVTWRTSNSNGESFVSTDSASRRSSIRNIAQLSAKAISINRYGKTLVTSEQDRKMTIWDWTSKTPTSFGGHSREVDFAFLIPGASFKNHVLVSASLGEASEILKTDLATFEDEVVPVLAGRTNSNDQPSPTTISKSKIDNQLAVGNDFGQASVLRNGTSIQWDVSAWKKHILSDDYVFAQSRGDYIYRFNRTNGNLDGVLTSLAQEFEKEVVKFEVSKTGTTALVVTDERAPRFHVWDLVNDRKIRTVNYGADNVFGTGSQKELLALTISPDGKWIIGGKVGVFAWSTQSGGARQLTRPSPENARSAISAIKFINDGTRFVVSWKDRIDAFDLNNLASTRSFTTKDVTYNKNESNLYGVREQGNRIFILARSIATTGKQSGINLIDLQSQTTVAEFDAARFASFADGSNDVIVVNKSTNQSNRSKKTLVQKWNSSTRATEDINTDSLQGRFEGRFSVIETAFMSDNQITLQTSTKNENSSIRRDWNTISLNADETLGAVRIIAKPKLQYHVTSGDRSITLEHGNIRLWKLFNNSVQPDGIVEGDFECCELSPDEKTLAAVPSGTNKAILFDPKSGKKLQQYSLKNESPITAIAWSGNGNSLAFGSQNGSVEVLKATDGKLEYDSSIPVSKVPISKITFANASNSILAISQKAGIAHALQRSEDEWIKVTLGHIDDKQIVTGDLDPTGTRAVTGTLDGRLTLWNSESSKSTSADDGPKVERELYNFQNQHQSAIQFVEFLESSNGDIEVASSEANSGDNQFLLWKSKPLKE